MARQSLWKEGEKRKRPIDREVRLGGVQEKENEETFSRAEI